jgi:molecular chaperone GrpE (heat shock protein)
MEDSPAEQPAGDRAPVSGDQLRIDDPAELSRIAERLSDLESQGAEYHRRAAYREAIIDRLHRENEKLRDEARGSVFDPITADLIRLYDSFCRDAERFAENGAEPGIIKLMESYAEDVQLILDRCGLEPFGAATGEPFRVGEHAVAGTAETPEESRHNTVAEVLAVGFRDRVSGQVKRPLRARFYRAAMR